MTDLAETGIEGWDANFAFALAGLPFPGDWAKQGRCRSMPHSVFFPARGDHQAVEQALAICARCPVLEECRAYAVAAPGQLVGIWGGLTGQQRRMAHKEWLATGAEESEPTPKPERTKRAWRGTLYRQLGQLIAHPGRWARVVRYPAASSATAMASQLRTGQRTLPEGRWEFEGRLNDEGGSDLYARFLGAEQEGVA